MAKVSVVIPVYNVKEYLSRTVASVRMQTERDIEILLVDDGSTDGSGQLCDAMAAEDARIRVIHQPNAGLSAARNTGVKAATGEFVLLLDGDDRLHPEAAARTLAVMREAGADLVQFRYREVSPVEQTVLELSFGEISVANTPTELFTNLYRMGGVGASACTKLFRRELLVRIPFEHTRHEDEQWCTRAFAEPIRAAYIDDVLYDYVIREGSIVRSGFCAAQLDGLAVSTERLKVLERLGLADCLREEYRRLFLLMLRLYRDAADAGDGESVKKVKAAFLQHKEKLRICAELKGKFALQFRLMCVRFEAAELYRFYWKFRRKL